MKEKDITSEVVRQIRKDFGLTQSDFWTPIGVAQSTGCQYESGTTQIPTPVRLLLVLKYVHGIDVEAGKEPRFSKSKLDKVAAAKKLAARVEADLDRSIQKLQEARSALQTI